MAVVGDRVRFLNSTGGGVVTKIDGRIAYVEEDGFETPVLLSEVVVVLPAGHEPAGGAKKMFDQSAFDQGREKNRKQPEPKATAAPVVTEPLPVEETEYGDAMNLVLGFEPVNIKELSKTTINAVLVNDSNYFLSFSFLVRDDATHNWRVLYQGEAGPNELVDLASYTQATINEVERIVFQAIAYKRDKSFAVKSPIGVSKKIDVTKFYKVNCFRPGVYFESPAIEISLYEERR